MIGRPSKPVIRSKILGGFCRIYGKVVMDYPDVLNRAIETKNVHELVTILIRLGMKKSRAYEYAKVMQLIGFLTVNAQAVKVWKRLTNEEKSQVSS